MEEDLRKGSEIEVEGLSSSDIDLREKKSPEKLAKHLNEETILLDLARERNNQNNIEGFHQNLLIDMNIARCLEMRPIKKCLYLSSVSVYGEETTNMEIVESTSINPSALYGVGKYVGEKVMRSSANKAGFPLLILRSCKVYGPGNPDTLSYGPDKFINTIKEDNKLFLFGEGEEKRDYLFIDDLISIIKQLTFSETRGVLNLVSGNSYSFKEIASLLRKITKRDFSEINLDRKNKMVHQGFTIDKLVSACAGMSFTDLQKGLQSTWNFAEQ